MRSLIISVFVCAFTLVKAQTFYSVDTIQEIRIYFSFSNWDYRLDTLNSGTGGYLKADSVIINSVHLSECGVKYKGSSSYDSTFKKNPIHIRLDKYSSQDYQGYTNIKLGNGYTDNSMLREPLSYAILRQYMDEPQSNFARVYINDAYYGIMNNTEDIDNNFLLNKFFSNHHTFIKCNPPGVSPSGSNTSNLAYNGSVILNYDSVYELKSDTGWSELIQLCDTLNNHFASFNSIADIDRFLWMLSFNNALVNLDSYSGVFRQNYYLYRNHAAQWIPTIWDLNMSFGGFGIAGGIVSNLTPTTMQTMSYTLHKSETGWPLLYQLLNDVFYSKMYYAHLRTINNENFANASYKAAANAMHTLIDTAVQTDTNFFSSYADFQNSLTTSTIAGGSTGQCPGLFPLMDGRASYLSNVLSAAPPVITNVNSGNGTTYGSTTTITTQVTNTTNVFLGYRYGKQERFVRVPMYDDGIHADGAANDNVFGAAILLNSLNVQYYIYAENSNTGAFSPERAEHEFYTISPTITSATSGEIVINEFTSNNSTGIENEEGKFKDWIELYNTTSQPLGLAGIYFSDSAGELTKWNFPSKAFIKPDEHLLVWADDLNKTFVDFHTNFNLNNLGESIVLSDGNTIFDSITFSNMPNDAAIGRCADGTGNFTSVALRTPRAANDCSSSIAEISSLGIALYPNPASAFIQLVTNENISKVELFSLQGQRLFTTSAKNIDISNLEDGFYILRVTSIENKSWNSRFLKIVSN